MTTTHDGQILENFHAENVIIRHNNVTLRNFKVTREDPLAWFAITQLDHANGGQVTGTIIEDGQIRTEVNGVPTAATGHAINGAFMIVRRMDISYMDNAIIGREYLAEGNYIHDMERYGSEHPDGIVSTGGNNITIRRNTVLLPGQPTGTVSLFANSAPINNVLIEDNYLNGGSYTIYHRDQGKGVPTNVRVLNNRFGRDYMYGILRSDGPLTWSGNVWADTGAPVNP